MTGLLQTVKPTTPVKQDVSAVMPTQQKIGNKKVSPVTQAVMPNGVTTTSQAQVQATAVKQPGDVIGAPVKPQDPLTPTWSPTKAGVDPVPSAPEVDSPIFGPINRTNTPTVPQGTAQTPTVPQGTAQTPSLNTQYDVSNVDRPNVDSATLRGSASVEDRLTGLLDSDSKYIREARLRAEEESAARGLRNSSLAAGAGERAAIQSALPIAQQDAQQDFTLQRDGVQQGYQLDQMGYDAGLKQTMQRDNNQFQLTRDRFQGDLQNEQNQFQLQRDRFQADLQNEQNQFQLQRDRFAADLQSERDQLLYQQQMGQLSAQQQYRLQELEYTSQLGERRDALLNQFDKDARLQAHAMDMEKIQKDFENRMLGLDFEMSHQNRQSYTNAAYQTQIAAMEQIAAIYQNPEMSAEQQRRAVAEVYKSLNTQMERLSAIYDPLPGVDFEDEDSGNPSTPNVPGAPTTPTPPGGITNPGGAPGLPTPDAPIPTVPGRVWNPGYDGV